MKKYLFSFISGLFFTVYPAFASEEVLIIFDASLSMGDKLGGVPKLQLAAEETSKFAASLPPSQPLGLRIIGLVIDSNIINYLKKPEDLCRASKLAVPISADSAENIKNALNNVYPLGVTPLVYSIETALEHDFSSGAFKHIVLVTDGADACGGDLCSYVSSLSQHRNDVRIDIIALGAEAEEAKELKCLSDNTSGRMLSISSPSRMKQAYNSLFSFKRYDADTQPSSSVNPVKPYNYSIDKNIEYKNILMEFHQ